MAHNAVFDIDRFIRDIKRLNLASKFCAVVAGYFCSKIYFQVNMPQRNDDDGPGNSLMALAKDFVTVPISKDKYHDAVYDVKMLEHLVDAKITKEEIVEGSKSFFERVMKEKVESTYDPLRKVVSTTMINRMILHSISYAQLQGICNVQEEENANSVIKKLFTRKNDVGKCCVTSRTKIIDAIVNHFKDLNKK